MQEIRHAHRRIYQANARRFDAERGRSLFERPWLDRFLSLLPEGGTVLDLGCGAGEPIAGYLIGRGFRVTGVDFAPAMLEIARDRHPAATWVEADMRTLDLGVRFDGIVGWDSFFHLTRDEQRALLPRLGRHLAPAGALLLSVGHEDGEVLGRVGDETVYHASLSPDEYAERLAGIGLSVEAFVAEDPGCGFHSVLLARAAAC